MRGHPRYPQSLQPAHYWLGQKELTSTGTWHVLLCLYVSPASIFCRDKRPKRVSVFFNAVHPKEIHLGILCSLIYHIIRFLYLLLSWEVYINRLILM